jgi:hypothetical protein
VQTAELIADLEKGLAAARELAAEHAATPLTATEPIQPDTSQMPGGVDSAPVSSSEPEPAIPAIAEAAKDFAPVEHAAETGGLDILNKLMDGHTVKEVAGLLHGIESNTAAESIVRAIADLAQGVRI